MSSPASPPPKVVLNIGGERFETTAATLTKVPRSFFPRLLSGAIQLPRDADGAHFIDRDPHCFPHILTWLRAFDPSSPLQRSTNLLVSYRNAQHDKLADITGLPSSLYSHAATHRAICREVEFYGLIPLLFALDPTHPSVTSYTPAAPSARAEDVDRALREWEGDTNVPDLALLKAYQASLANPGQAGKADAQRTAAQEAEEAVADFEGLGGFAPLMEGVKASLLAKNGEVMWTPPAGFDVEKHGDTLAAEVKRRYGLCVDILGNELQLQPIA